MSSSDVSSNFLKLLPQYDCHKRVGALKIALVLPNPRGIELHFTDESVVPFQMSDEWDKKHSPYAGGYLVAYADGYLSFSPPAAFEQGYKPVSDDATNAPCWSSQAVLDTLSERRIQANNRDFAYDDRRTQDELVGAALAYLLPSPYLTGGVPEFWPFASSSFVSSNRRSNLVKASAFILAEIERIDRASVVECRAGESMGRPVGDGALCGDEFVCFSFLELSKLSIAIAAMSAQPLTSNAIASFAQECSVIAKRDGLVFVSVFWVTDGMYGLFKKQTSDC